MATLMRSIPYIPPSGMLGAGQQTQAAQAALMGRTSVNRGGGSRRRRSSSKRRARSSGGARRSRISRKPARLVKGSRAAKAFMAKLRRKRK